jgi:hypothetical protein
MTNKQLLKTTLICGLFFISLGGWLLHLRIHPIYSSETNFVPFISGIISVFIIPTMFIFSKTIPFAYLINGMTVIIGTITMADYSISTTNGNLTIAKIFLETTFPDIIILWSKFVFGKVLFDLWRTNDLNGTFKGKFWRFPNNGFWIIHFISMTSVYMLGKIFWK